MKRIIVVFLLITLLLSGCSTPTNVEISQDQIVAAYEAAGYTVYSRQFTEKTEDGIVGYVQADHENGDYIYFAVFETADEAAAYKNSFSQSFWESLVSIFSDETSAEQLETYGCIVATYSDSTHLSPLKGLLS